MNFEVFGVPISIVRMESDQIKVSKLGITGDGKFKSVAEGTDQASQEGSSNETGQSCQSGESPAKPGK